MLPASLRRPLISLGFCLACLAAFALTAWLFVRVFAPERQAAAVAPTRGFDARAMRAATTVEAVAERQRQLLALGSRYLGQPGLTAAEHHVLSAFRAAGLEIHQQHLRTVAPRTAYREIYRADVARPPWRYGAPLDDVEVYPLMPNHFQPVVTPEEGLEGELVLLDEQALATRKDFRDVIGVLDAAPGGVSPDYGFHWTRYARLGVKAVIVAHRDGIAAIDWQALEAPNPGAPPTNAMVSSVPVNYVRLAAGAGIFEHLGQRVRLRVRADFVEHPNRTIFGVLRAPKPATEAVVFYAPLDAPSVLPDLAPGGLPALNVAYLLELVQGIGAVRGTLSRDVIFMTSSASVMGEDGLNQLLRVLQFNSFASHSNRLLDAFGPLSTETTGASTRPGAAMLETRLQPIDERARENRAHAAWVKAALDAFSAPDFLRTVAATRERLDRLSDPARAFFLEQFQYVLNTLVFERQEPVLQAKLRFERAGARTDSREFSEYLKARQALDRATAVAGSPPVVLLERSAAFAERVALRARVHARFAELGAFHALRTKELESDRAVATLFSRYRDFAIFRPQLAPAASDSGTPEVLSLYAKSSRESQSIDLLLGRAARKLDDGSGTFRVEPIASRPIDQSTVVEKNVAPAPVYHYWMVYGVGYNHQSWVNLSRQAAYQRWASPVLLPFMTELSSLRGSFAALGELALSLVHGDGLLGSPQGYPWQRRNYGGRVLVSNVGQAIVPSYPLKGALIGARSLDKGVRSRELHSRAGYWQHPFYKTDPYGRFDLPEQASDFGVWWRMYDDGHAYTPLAAGFGEDGLIAYMKDEGEEGQRLFKSVGIPLTNLQLVEDATVVTFRAAPLSILDLTNPRDFKDYAEVEMIDSDGLSPFGKRCQFVGPGFITTYLPPDETASVLLKAGRPDNEFVREIRAFLLGVGPDPRSAGVPLEGDGYLVADQPFLQQVPLEAARSMAHVNDLRLELQNRYGMADDRTNDYHRKTLELLGQAQAPGTAVHDTTLKARDAVSYAGLNHPVLRESVFEAVIGILWYLGLLVPFVYFAEKLLFCFADVRRQIAAQSVIFLSVFALLRVLHPAFEMVRSSLMILLGFLIVLISTGIALLFSSTAKENLAELRKRQGKVAAAQVNPLGVLTASFLVGLNNMHRRRLRTGLTCATLTLLTFVMICFTSTQNDLVEETTTLGRADYQGLLAKHDDFLPMTESELFALKSKFAGRAVVAERRFYTGNQDWQERRRLNPSLTASFDGPAGPRQASFSSILKLTPEEPLRSGFQLLTGRGWFLPEHAQDDGGPAPVLLPDKLAERLGVRAEAVDAGEVQVQLNGRPFRVWGIFSAASLDGLRDLDGVDLLPYDIERVGNLSESKVGFTASVDEPRIPAERIVVAPVRDLKLSIPNANEVIASVAIDLGDASYREAKQAIEAHLEKTAAPAYFGLDGVAYRGLRTRQLTVAGLLELLVPLLIAGLTVLNTMKGSVYERRGEIYVYNAVGIAPRYILVMFLAEAFVYVVVGSVLGYLLSQGVGRVLTELGLTGGLNMTFTSLATIYASLAIAAAVFSSTWFPARSAMAIAAPAEDSGWKLPQPDGDLLALDLPFNFGARDRIAVLGFFQRWLREHGEGSSGRFFAAEPALGVAEGLDAHTGGLVPELALTVWLKPFDLAVSQALRISAPFDPETGQFQARLELTRLSGTRESWLRLNQGFVAGLRRHFLHWRAVTDADRAVMFAEARDQLAALQAELRPAEGEA